MTTIIAGSAAQFAVEVLADGALVPLSGTIQARIYNMTGRTELVPAQDLAQDAPGADWLSGVAVVSLTSDQTANLAPGDVMLVLTGAFGIRRYRLAVETLLAPTRTSLFIKDIVVGDMRREQLMAAAAGVLQDVRISDDYIWSKIRSAESEIAHRLRVPLVPTRFFPVQPTQEQIDALDGMAWAIEVGHDYMPDMFERDKWGFIVTRQRPVISVERLRFAMPSADGSYFDIPKEWIRIDAKYGHLRILPTTNAYLVTTGIMGMTALTWQSTIPNMIQLEYTAGLTDVENTYPELLDAIKKQAVCKIVTEAFMPQSGSISADGLSQSLSVDISKYQDTIDHIIDGPEGANGGLQAKINGIRSMVI